MSAWDGSERRSTPAPTRSSLRSHRRAFDAAVEFVAAIGPALVPRPDRIGRQLGIGGGRRITMILGAPLRPVAETESGRIIPPRARIVRCAIKDLAANV